MNIANLEYEDTIERGSLKLIQITINNYERSILTMKTDFDKGLAKINYFHSNHREALIREIEKYDECLHKLLVIRPQNKNERDNIDVKE